MPRHVDDKPNKKGQYIFVNIKTKSRKRKKKKGACAATLSSTKVVSRDAASVDDWIAFESSM